MKASWNYLKKVLPLKGKTPEEVADKLTFAGAEVEEVSHLAKGDHLVIGHIISCKPHPDSDHLHVLEVDEGKEYGVHQIVCGAPNAREGLNVIVARNGANLIGGKIAPSVIRGVESDGMCCSLLELGVDKKYLSEKQVSGIEELPLDAPVGEEDVLGYLGLDDVVIDVSVLPNRPDLYALNNIAREVSCLEELPLDLPAYEPLSKKKDDFYVSSNSPKCPQFSAMRVNGIDNRPSPKELSSLLNACGIRSISSAVDVGNLVMLLSGQPVNFYDADKLPKQELVVVDDYEGEFLAMDGKSYRLEKGDLLVTSGGLPMCLAGIMTADACRVDENTKNIIVEVANFAYASIRHTSNRLGLSSDSSLRYCKGINPDQALDVQKMAAHYLKEYCSASDIYEVKNYDTLKHDSKVIEVSLGYINGRLGTSFDLETVKAVLLRDGFQIETKGDSFVLTVPSFRIDIDGKADISEEVIRILGYSYVPSTLPLARLSCKGLTSAQSKEREIRHYLFASGVSEVLTYSLLSSKEALRFPYLSSATPLKLSNPMTDEHEVLRKEVLHSVLKAASYNSSRQNKDGAFFEISDVDAEGLKSRYLALALFGDKKEWGELKARPYDFYDAKGLVEGILDLLGLGSNRVSFKRFDLGGDELHPGKSALLVMGKKILGFLCELHPSAKKEYGLKNASVIELDLAALLEMKTSLPKAEAPSKYPSVSRDLALVLPKETTYEDLSKEIKKADKLVKEVSLFDVYEGEGIADGKKSLALTITFLDKEKTLKDEEVKAATERVLSAIKARFGAEIRG